MTDTGNSDHRSRRDEDSTGRSPARETDGPGEGLRAYAVDTDGGRRLQSARSDAPEPIHVLHVEDDPAFADLAVTALEGECDRLEVETADSARTALERLAAGGVDCVVSDYDMPDVDGLALLEAVRRDHSDLPFILYTGKGSEEIASDAISAGVTDYLQKGGGLDQFALLGNRIENAVTKRRTEEALRRREASHREAQRIAGLGHWEWEVGTGDLFWSDEVYRMFGLEPGAFESTYESFLSHVHPDDREAVEAAVEDALESGTDYAVRHRVVRPDGAERVVHERGEVTFDDGEPVLMRGTVQDVTDQAAVEAELEERRRTITAIHRAATDLERCTDEVRLFARAVEAAESILDFDCCVFYRQDDGRLRPVATSTDLDAADARPESLRRGVAERTVATGETQRVEDGTSGDVPLPDPYRSALGVPVGDRAVFLAVGREPGTFSEDDARLAELLASHVGSVHDRIEREADRRALEAAVEAAGHSIYVTDLTGIIQYVNPAFCETTGYSREEAVGQTPRILKSGEHDATFYEDLWGTITAGEVWHNEVVNRRKDGERYVVDQTIAPISGPDGEIDGFVAVNTDVTARDARERAVERSRRRYRSLIESSPDAIFVADVETGELVETNPAASALLGRPESDILGTHQSELHPSDAPDQYRALFENHVADAPATMDRLPNGEPIEVVTADGGRVQVEINADVLEFEDQTLVQGVFRDLTDLRQRERDLARQNERLDEFASVVAHDLRNPLSVAIGTAEMVEFQDQAAADRMGAALDRMADIIDELLALARQGDAVDLSETISLERAAERAWQTVETGEAELVVEADRPLLANDARLRAVLENLFANAVEHVGEGVTVRVGATADGFYLEDDGPGIPAEERDRIFRAGYTTREDGTGFGLAIVRRIAEAHGWTVSADESAAGGVRFEFGGVDRPDDDATRAGG